MTQRVVIVPCSGIGKSYGTVAREGAYVVTEDLRPDTTQLVPLSLLVLGDAQARADVSGAQAITIDGCKLACATKMVQKSGGTLAHDLAVLDVYRRHRDLKPAGIAELDEGGQKLAQALAKEVVVLVDALAPAPPLPTLRLRSGQDLGEGTGGRGRGESGGGQNA